MQGFRFSHSPDLSPSLIGFLSDALSLRHDPAGRPLWLTEICDRPQLLQALDADWAGVVEYAPVIPAAFTALRQSCPDDGSFLLLTTRSAHALDLAGPLSSVWRQSHGFGDEQGMDMELALQEALANAVLHGNLGLDSSWRAPAGLRDYARTQRQRLGDPLYGQRLLGIASHRQDDCLHITVLNEGDGFDWRMAVQPHRLQADQARGLSLIHRLSRQTSFADQGRSITMVMPIGTP